MYEESVDVTESTPLLPSLPPHKQYTFVQMQSLQYSHPKLRVKDEHYAMPDLQVILSLNTNPYSTKIQITGNSMGYRMGLPLEVPHISIRL